MYKKVRALPQIKKAFIGSGIRYDIFLRDKSHKANNQYLEEIFQHHVSGRLKVAPEHVSENVLSVMRKPSFDFFKILNDEFNKLNKKYAVNQQLIPYFISSHPGSSIVEMANVAIETKQLHFKLEQVQDFTPTPMTLATEMYYTGINPYTDEKINTAKTKPAKEAQQLFFFWYKKENWDKIKSELRLANRSDLIQKIFGR